MEWVNWREEALCAGMWMMFDDDREDYESSGDLKAHRLGVTGRVVKGATSMQRVVRDECIAICNRCPVKTECLEDALKYGDDYTIRGGMTSWDRAKLILETEGRLRVGSRYAAARVRGNDDGDV